MTHRQRQRALESAQLLFFDGIAGTVDVDFPCFTFAVVDAYGHSRTIAHGFAEEVRDGVCVCVCVCV